MELDILRALQSFSHPALDIFFQLITLLGEEIVLIPLMALLYWNVDKRFGEILALTAFTSLLLNNALKELFSFARPMGEKGIRSLRVETATGKAFPSGHAQGAASLGTALALRRKKKRDAFLAGLLMALVAYSRLYLGLHYPKDVLAGLLLGIATAWCMAKLYRILNPRYLYALIFLVFLPFLFWKSSPDFVKAFGAYTGCVLGLFYEKAFVQFDTDGRPGEKTLRYLLGVLLLFALKEGLKLLFPEKLLFDGLRYLLVTFFALGLYPQTFRALRRRFFC